MSMNNSIYREEKYGAPTWASNENIMYMLNTINDPICKKCPSHSDTITNETDNNNNTEDGANGGAFNLDLELTQDCNYACKYCIERGYFEPKFMHPHIVEEVIKKASFLLSKKSNNYCNAISFGYWGGEPTLNNDAITRITRYFMKNDRVSFNVFTNSRLLSNYYDLIEETNKERQGRFNVQISYDGFDIHDLNRIDRDGKHTGNEVRNNIITLAKKNYSFHIKSTLTFKDLSKMYDSYMDICDLSDECRGYSNNHFIDYTPTIDYSTLSYNKLDNAKVVVLLTIFEEQLIKIANNEYKRYKLGLPGIFSWFDGFSNIESNYARGRSKCCAGYRYKCVNYDGNILVCHGCLFSPHKKDHYLGHIFNDNKTFLKHLINSDKFFNAINRGNSYIPEPTECKGCDATICYCCNAIKYEISNKKEYIRRWWDSSNQPFLCRFYKMASNVLAALKLKLAINNHLQEDMAIMPAPISMDDCNVNN